MRRVPSTRALGATCTPALIGSPSAVALVRLMWELASENPTGLVRDLNSGAPAGLNAAAIGRCKGRDERLQVNRRGGEQDADVHSCSAGLRTAIRLGSHTGAKG